MNNRTLARHTIVSATSVPMLSSCASNGSGTVTSIVTRPSAIIVTTDSAYTRLSMASDETDSRVAS